MSQKWALTDPPNYSSWAVALENSLFDTMRKQGQPEVKPKVVGALGNLQPAPRRQHANSPDDGSDLLVALHKPLIIGAAMGLIPIRAIFLGTTDQLKFSWFHWRTAVTAILTICIGCNIIFITDQFITMLTDTQRQSAGELVFAFSGIWFYIAGTCVYLFFLIRSGDLCKFFQRWTEVNKVISSTMSPDETIQRHVNLITLLVLGSCFGENVMFHFHVMNPDRRARIGELSAEELLADYYDSNKYICSFFEYKPLIALCFLLFNKLTLYAWNFGDVILMVLSRGIYGRFEGVNRYLERSMTFDKQGGLMIQRQTFITKGLVCWKTLRQNFLALVDVLEDANRIFAPLIWLSFVTDIFFVCNQLYIQLSPSAPSKSLVSSVYVVWSFLHLIMRTLAVNVMAAKINESAHRIRHILQHCHAEEYDRNVSRLEMYLRNREIGLTGNGCFVITRSFILKICSAIFTLEVVLLQQSDVVV